MSKATLSIAVVGVTGNVGRAMMTCLAEAGFQAKNIHAVASNASKGKKISFGETDILTIQDLDEFDFSKCDVVLSSPGAKVSEVFVPRAVACGCIVIDNTSFFRMDEDVPLIVPEVNKQDISGYVKKNIIANPNCSTIQLVMALAPLHKISPIKRVVCSTYQSVSGAGKAAMDELYHQTKGIFVNDIPTPSEFLKPIAFNVIPQIDVFQENGDTKEEWKMRVETKKILDDKIELTATCVRVPVFIGHSISANIEFEDSISVAKARTTLRNFPGIRVIDDPDNMQYMTPIEVANDDMVYISRIRQDPSNPHALNLWIVADNLRKGAALNAVQIAQELITHYL